MSNNLGRGGSLQASHLLANTLFAVLIYIVYEENPAVVPYAKMMTPTGHSLTGSALGLLLVFRTNSAYQRLYEARQIWGQLTNTIREMSLLVQSSVCGLKLLMYETITCSCMTPY